MELQQAVAEKDHQYQQFALQMNNLEKTLEQQNEVNRQLKVIVLYFINLLVWFINF